MLNAIVFYISDCNRTSPPPPCDAGGTNLCNNVYDQTGLHPYTCVCKQNYFGRLCDANKGEFAASKKAKWKARFYYSTL